MDRIEETDCRDCRLFYGYVCRLNLGKEHIWDHCDKFEHRTKKRPPVTESRTERQRYYGPLNSICRRLVLLDLGYWAKQLARVAVISPLSVGIYAFRSVFLAERSAIVKATPLPRGTDSPCRKRYLPVTCT